MKLEDRTFTIYLEDLEVRSTLANLLRDQGATVYCADNEHELRLILETIQPEMAIFKLKKASELMSVN